MRRSHKNPHIAALGFLTLLFFMWGFITVLNDILIPHLKGVFELSNVQAMLVQFTFFGAYFTMALPAGWVVERVGYQRGIVIGLAVTGIGALLFVPASFALSYGLFLLALFVLASGITVLQVAANPYVTILGPPETAASRLNLTQGLNSLGTTLGPILGAHLILATEATTKLERAGAVRLPYIGLGLVLFALAGLFAYLRLPKMENARSGGGSWAGLLGERRLLLGVVAIFLYVGAEVGIGSLMVLFFGMPETGALDEVQAGELVALYWGGAMVGRFVGAALQQRFSPAKVLAAAAAGAIVLVAITVLVLGSISVWTLLAVGLVNSVMFPTIFSMSLEGLGERTSRGSSLLVMAIVGGALLPMAMGAVADIWDYPSAIAMTTLCYAYIVYFAFAASPKPATHVQPPTEF